MSCTSGQTKKEEIKCIIAIQDKCHHNVISEKWHFPYFKYEKWKSVSVICSVMLDSLGHHGL